MTGSHVLLPDAEADLRGIIRHTRDKWGGAQARAYTRKLERAIADLANGQGFPKEMDEIYPGLRMVRCEHHYIFCLPRYDAPMLERDRLSLKHFVIASVAKQSRATLHRPGLLRRFAPRNDDSG